MVSAAKDLRPPLENRPGVRPTGPARDPSFGATAAFVALALALGGLLPAGCGADEGAGSVRQAKGESSALEKLEVRESWRRLPAAHRLASQQAIGPAALREALLADDPGLRAGAAMALGLGGRSSAAAAPDLFTALRDPEAEVREAAAMALGRIGVREDEVREDNVIAGLQRALDDPDARAAAAVAWALGRLAASNDRPTIEQLSRCLTDRPPLVQAAALRALALLGPEAGDTLRQHVGLAWSHDEVVRGTAIEVLASLGEAVVSPLVEALSTGESAGYAAATLARIGRSAVRPLIDALTDPGRRRAAVKALGLIGKIATRPLIEATRSPEAARRAGAIRALGSIGEGGEAMAARLAVFLGNPAAVIRVAAAWAMGRFGRHAARASSALVERLADPVPGVALAAAHSLEQIGPAAAPIEASLVAHLATASPPLRTALLRALASIGSRLESTHDKVLAYVEDDVPSVRAAAVGALGRMGAAARRDIPLLRRLLVGPTPSIRTAAAWALAQLRSTAEAPPVKPDR